MNLINLMIADDHLIMREGLKQLLESEEEFHVIAEANDGIECLQLLKKNKPDVLLLDIVMPNKSGIDVLEAMNQCQENQIKVIILTGHNEVEYLVIAEKLGADGYVLKDCGYDKLKQAIYQVMNGEKYIEPDLIHVLEKNIDCYECDRKKIETLTSRELEVLKNVAMGMYNKEIALKLDISERTVKNHISNIFKKIGVTDRTQAAVFTIKNKLINIYEQK